MMRNSAKASLGIVCMTFLLFVFNACYYDTVEELDPNFGTGAGCDTSGVISFDAKVKPILTSFCGTSGSAGPGCHGSNTSNNIPLASYQNVADAIPLSLMDAINHTNGASPMPKNGGKLDDCRIYVIQKWIDQGAQNN